MNKNLLKYLFLGLLLVAIVAVPIFGVSLYDFGYNSDEKDWFTDWTTVVPGITEEGSIITNMKFGGGTAIYLSYDSEDEKVLTEENLKKGAEILEARFQGRGYSDAKASVVDGLIRLDLALKTYIDSAVSEIASIGDWSFVGSDMTKVLCDGSYVEGAHVSAHPNGGYAITIEFTEKGAEEFFANTASYAVNTSSFYLMVDGQFTAAASISDATVRDTFTFGQYELSNATALATIIDNGKLPAAVQIEKTEAIDPTLGTALLAVICAASAAVVIAAAILLFIKGKKAGIFAVAALVADISVFLTAMLSADYQFNFVTLITMLVLLALGTVLYLFAIAPVGKGLAAQKAVTFSEIDKLNKFNIKSLIIHGTAIAIALICHIFVTGVFYSIVRSALIFACANLIFYFLFFYFGVRVMATPKK